MEKYVYSEEALSGRVGAVIESNFLIEGSELEEARRQIFAEI